MASKRLWFRSTSWGALKFSSSLKLPQRYITKFFFTRLFKSTEDAKDIKKHDRQIAMVASVVFWYHGVLLEKAEGRGVLMMVVGSQVSEIYTLI